MARNSPRRRLLGVLADGVPRSALDLIRATGLGADAVGRLVQASVEILRKVMHPHGFNIGINSGKVAGAGVVDHVHVHVVPRWLGDTNFMPVIGDTKVISVALDRVYEMLKPWGCITLRYISTEACTKRPTSISSSVVNSVNSPVCRIGATIKCPLL